MGPCVANHEDFRVPLQHGEVCSVVGVSSAVAGDSGGILWRHSVLFTGLFAIVPGNGDCDPSVYYLRATKEAYDCEDDPDDKHEHGQLLRRYGENGSCVAADICADQYCQHSRQSDEEYAFGSNACAVRRQLFLHHYGEAVSLTDLDASHQDAFCFPVVYCGSHLFDDHSSETDSDRCWLLLLVSCLVVIHVSFVEETRLVSLCECCFQLPEQYSR